MRAFFPFVLIDVNNIQTPLKPFFFFFFFCIFNDVNDNEMKKWGRESSKFSPPLWASFMNKEFCIPKCLIVMLIYIIMQSMFFPFIEPTALLL